MIDQIQIIAEILGVAAFIISIILLVIHFSRYTFSQTYEFVEKDSIQEKKKRVQQKLFIELKEKFKLISNKVDDLSNEDFQFEMWRFGGDASLCTLPTKILNQIQYNYAKMNLKLIRIITGSLLFILGIILYQNIILIPGNVNFPLGFYLILIGLAVIIQNRDIYKMHKNTLKLRINFNQISDDINLEKMKELEDRLKNEKAI